ncbi:hypothetical protein PM082_022996 [Marasmius tenuissimus]|nr:hypothetical protein PM082_011591 [Marasmius tenuissimus]KAJ8092351.1 hypothetical protein PM082_023806 [Marasmius tenuissimus]KAJ8095590.1 hypothetical protein PM082_022996 [Marasmius tenuissimus]
MGYEAVKAFKEDVCDVIFDITEAYGGDVPADEVEGECIVDYCKGQGKGKSFLAAGQLHKYCKKKTHSHAFQQSVAGERMKVKPMRWMLMLRAIHDILPGKKYNPQDAAREADVEMVLGVLRQVLTRVKVAFENFETTGVFDEPDISMPAQPRRLLGSSSKSPTKPLAQPASPQAPSFPPPSTHQWFFTPAKPPPSKTYHHRIRKTKAISGTPRASTSRLHQRAPATRASLGSATSTNASTQSSTPTSTKTLAALAAKRKQGTEGMDSTPSRPSKKLRSLGTLDISDDEADQSGSGSSLRKDKGKMKALDVRNINDTNSPMRKGRGILKDIVLAPDSDEEEDDDFSPVKPLRL